MPQQLTFPCRQALEEKQIYQKQMAKCKLQNNEIANKVVYAEQNLNIILKILNYKCIHSLC